MGVRTGVSVGVRTGMVVSNTGGRVLKVQTETDAVRAVWGAPAAATNIKMTYVV